MRVLVAVLPVLVAVLPITLQGIEPPTSSSSPPAIDFNRDIRPLLSNYCLQCHGPDEEERQGATDGLRLDIAEDATMDLGGYAAIVPGDPENSELMRRIVSDDEGERMPPPEFGKQLGEHEVSLLKEWIAQGAQFARHWSYAPPRRPEIPAIERHDWPRNEIDYFILQRLEAEGLAPAPEADRATLIRRLALDLTGLPPAPEEVQRFLEDSSHDAYEQLVDRLLQKKSYGEHWARKWLDLARYADSAGYADDPPRTIWAYRDYVIQSFNKNKPFDEFTREQLAGDLLPRPTDEQLIATAFHRNTLTNNEGGTNDEEFRNVAVVDRVNTTMAVWMGTTMACAQCHTHKYDPITQEEYFRFFAIFNSTADADRRDESPLLEIFDDEQKQRRDLLREESKQLEERLSTLTPELAVGLDEWDRDFPRELPWNVLVPTSVESTADASFTIEKEGVIRVERQAETDTYTVTVAAPSEILAAIQLETLPREDLPGNGAGHGGGNFVLSRVTAHWLPFQTSAEPLPSDQNPAGDDIHPLSFKMAYADYSQDGFLPEHVLKNPDVKTKGWAVGGAVAEAHTLTLVFAEPVEADPKAELRIVIEQLSQHAHHTLANFRLRATSDPRVIALDGIPNSVKSALRVERSRRDPSQQSEITRYYLRSVAPELKESRDRQAQVTRELDAIKPITTVPVMRELTESERRRTHIQFRGNFLDQGHEVSPGLPAAFPPPPPDAPLHRLTLANWIMADENPLVGRVVANRYWETIFGIGLVSSSEEFGSQGDLPSHPALLDWLATELPRRKWDLKSFLTLLVTSATYRQASHVTPARFERDPDNRLLARGPRFRLSAEAIRDQALFVSGLLSEKIYGPPAQPAQPSSGLNAAFGSGIDWKTSEGEDQYRRGLYTNWRRSNPYPSMVTFDAPNREVCTVQRSRTNTPLQALVTLNDPVYVEAAQSLARRMLAVGNSPAEHVDHGFLLCLSRPPHATERARLLELHEVISDRYRSNISEARKMIGASDTESPADEQVVQQATWVVIANVLLNLDEMFMKR
jgi:hypothetical protein